MQTRARIVLAAAEGTPSREIGRMLSCTTGTVSKWRVRYARLRFAGLDETGNRGAEPKYGPAEQKRILAMLISPRRPAMATGPRHCWRVRSVMSTSSISGASCVRRRSICPAANPGARAATRISLPRRPTLLA